MPSLLPNPASDFLVKIHLIENSISMLMYLKKPYYRTPERCKLLSNIIFVIKYVGVYFLLSFLALLFMFAVDKTVIHFLQVDSIITTMKATRKLSAEFRSQNKLLICLIGPFLEELIFRLPLNLKKWSIALSLSILAFSLSGKGIYSSDFSSIETLLRLAFAIACFWGLMLVLPDSILLKLKNKYFAWYFNGVALLFGLIHIDNYKMPMSLLPLMPIFVVPQIIMGFLLGGTRMKYGFAWGLVLHCLINSITIILK